MKQVIEFEIGDEVFFVGQDKLAESGTVKSVHTFTDISGGRVIRYYVINPGSDESSEYCIRPEAVFAFREEAAVFALFHYMRYLKKPPPEWGEDEIDTILSIASEIESGLTARTHLGICWADEITQADSWI